MLVANDPENRPFYAIKLLSLINEKNLPYLFCRILEAGDISSISKFFSWDQRSTFQPQTICQSSNLCPDFDLLSKATGREVERARYHTALSELELKSQRSNFFDHLLNRPRFFDLSKKIIFLTSFAPHELRMKRVSGILPRVERESWTIRSTFLIELYTIQGILQTSPLMDVLTLFLGTKRDTTIEPTRDVSYIHFRTY